MVVAFADADAEPVPDGAAGSVADCNEATAPEDEADAAAVDTAREGEGGTDVCTGAAALRRSVAGSSGAARKSDGGSV